MFVLTTAQVFKKENKESQFLFDKFVWKKSIAPYRTMRTNV